MSGQINETEIDLAAVHGSTSSEQGVRHADQLIAFTDAVMANDPAAIEQGRAKLRGILSDEEFVDVAAIIAAFNVVTRIADATGIPLDPVLKEMSADVRAELKLYHFPSSANTP